MLVAVLSGYALALLAPLIHRAARGATGWLLGLLPLALTLYFVRQADAVVAGEVQAISYAWIPSLGVNLSFYLDGWALLFALLITGMGSLIILYAGGYLGAHRQLGLFYSYLLVFMASMLGLVLADNIIGLFVFWELTSLSSYLLIGFNHEHGPSRAGALQALVVTAGGGLALLAGLLLMAQVGGSFELRAFIGQADQIRAHGLYPAIVLLVLLGAFTKSAQAPFHFWLPNAMQAPTPVSAYLHSATMVKAGIYLLARFNPILGGTDLWQLALTSAGAVTALLGAFLAVRQVDMKRMLAYSTVSALGALVCVLGIGTPAAMKAVVVSLAAHATYKGALFLIVGAIDHEAKTRNVLEVGGLGKSMPITAIAAAASAVSMMGIPPLFGFVGKELLYDAAVAAPTLPMALAAALVVTSALLVVVAASTGLAPFMGRRIAGSHTAHEAPLSMLVGPVALAALGLALGASPNVASALAGRAASGILGQSITLKLALWHGWTPALAMSAVALFLGAILFTRRGALRRPLAVMDGANSWGAERWYSRGLELLNALASWQTRILQSGYLRYYLLTIIATTIVLCGYALFSSGYLLWPREWLGLRFYEIGVVVLMFLGIIVAVQAQSRLTAVVALGVVGYGMALIFVLFGAPDLAMTQFMIETLTVILLVLVFYHLPRFARLSTRPARLRDIALATAAGGLATAFVLAAISVQYVAPISSYFMEQSVPLAHGRNVVNVILVDFRALDTLGEITVLALAGVGVFALLKLHAGTGSDS